MNRRGENELQLVNEAADWFARLESGERDCQAAFLDWVRQSPVHVREFLAISQMSRRLTGIDPHRRRNAHGLAAQGEINVVPLQSAATGHGLAVRRSSTRQWIGAAAASALIALGVLFFHWNGTQFYATDLGEQRVFKLSDGSLIHLNTRSRAQVRYDEHARTVALIEGEALFTVSQDAARPFRVNAGEAVIEAVGTQFNVYLHPTATTVAVVEGRVRVSDATPAKAMLLSAGESAQIDRKGAVIKEAAAVDQAIAWRQRLLEFKETTLAEAAAEFNRYNALQIHVEGDSIRALQVTGFFNVDNPEGLLSFLDKDDSLDIVRDGQSVTIRGRRFLTQY